MHFVSRCARSLRGLPVLLAVAVALGGLRAAERSVELDTPRLRAVMAAYLVNFAVHVRWPETEREGEALTLVVLGPDRLGETLDRAVAGRTVQGRPLRVVRLERIEEFDEGDLVFMDRPALADAERVAQALADRPVLFVAFSDLPEGTPAAVDLVLMRDGTLRYKLAVSRMREAGLTPSAGLLQNALRGDERQGQLAPGGLAP
jgi:hypothetical protein